MPMTLPSSQQPQMPVGKTPPTGAATDSYSRFPNVAPGGGGVLTPGGQQNMGTGAYDDGGPVPDQDGAMPDQGAGAATVDPMSMVKQALSFGRKQFGMPQQFHPSTDNESNGPVGSFDDGGEVENEPQGADQSGQGVISQGDDQAAGGGMVDPKAAMHYLTGTGAVSPEIANAMEQQVDPQGQMDPAERALKAIAAAGDPQKAFALMQHYRGRFNAHAGAARAALDQGNMAQAAKSATQAMQNVPNGHSVRFAPAPGGLAVMSKPIGQQQPQPGMEDGGVIASKFLQQGMDDGGEVEEDTQPAGVLDTGEDKSPYPTDFVNSEAGGGGGGSGWGAEDQGPQHPTGFQARREAANAANTAAVTPTVIPAEKVKELLTDHDKLLEAGWSPVKGLKDLLGGMFGGAPEQQGPPAPVPMPQPRPPAADATQRGGMEKTANPTPESAKPAPKPVEPKKPVDTSADEKEQRIIAQANRLFPNVYDAGGVKAAYIQKMLEKEADNAGKEHAADVRAAGRQAVQEVGEAGKNARAEAGRTSKQAIETDKQTNLNNRSAAQNVRIAGNEYLRQHPNAKPDEIQGYLKGMGYDPKAIAAAYQQGGQPAEQTPASAQTRPNMMYLGGKKYEIHNGKYFPASGQ